MLKEDLNLGFKELTEFQALLSRMNNLGLAQDSLWAQKIKGKWYGLQGEGTNYLKRRINPAIKLPIYSTGKQDAVLYNCVPETQIILLASVTPINSKRKEPPRGKGNPRILHPFEILLTFGAREKYLRMHKN